MEINLTEKEQIALNELCLIQELGEEQIIRQSLRLYQKICLGFCEVIETELGRTLGLTKDQFTKRKSL